MAIKKEELKQIKLSAKGVLKDITSEGFVILDEKDNTEDILSFDDIKNFLVGKSVNIYFANKEKVNESQYWQETNPTG